MRIEIEHVDGVAVVVPIGVLTGDPRMDTLQATLEELIQAGQKKILLNLAKTPFMTSRAFGVLIAVNSAARKQSVHLYTCEMQDRVKKVIQVIRVTGWPKQFDDYETALEAMQKL